MTSNHYYSSATSDHERCEVNTIIRSSACSLHCSKKGHAPVHEHNIIRQKKRKTSQVEDSSLMIESNSHSKANKNRKQKRLISGNDDDDKNNDYVHVRAKRGQATDSHSLAERVRREKICERMKMLQELVPGCNKLNGKAHILDEIINYVQSLQNQIEFLSMKLASVSPIWYDFENELGNCMSQAENLMMMKMQQQQPMPLVDQTEQQLIYPSAFRNGTNVFQPMDHAVPVLFQHQGATSSLSQDSGSFVAQVGNERLGLLNHIQQLNMCTFH